MMLNESRHSGCARSYIAAIGAMVGPSLTALLDQS